MSNTNTKSIAAYLRRCRKDAKELGVVVPKDLGTYCHDHGETPFYEVWLKGEGIVWRGPACSESEAIAKYIEKLITEYKRTSGIYGGGAA